MAGLITFRDCKLTWKNLRGLPTKYNEDGGIRSFNIVIEDEELAKELLEDGWNVKAKKYGDDDAVQYELPVEARYNNIPPRIWIVTSGGETLLDEETVGQIDQAEIIKVDVTVKGRDWEDGGVPKVKAYCRTMFVTIEEDELEAEYLHKNDDIPF